MHIHSTSYTAYESGERRLLRFAIDGTERVDGAVEQNSERIDLKNLVGRILHNYNDSLQPQTVQWLAAHAEEEPVQELFAKIAWMDSFAIGDQLGAFNRGARVNFLRLLAARLQSGEDIDESKIVTPVLVNTPIEQHMLTLEERVRAKNVLLSYADALNVHRIDWIKKNADHSFFKWMVGQLRSAESQALFTGGKERGKQERGRRLNNMLAVVTASDELFDEAQKINGMPIILQDEKFPDLQNALKEQMDDVDPKLMERPTRLSLSQWSDNTVYLDLIDKQTGHRIAAVVLNRAEGFITIAKDFQGVAALEAAVFTA
jgi:hypothetical protein